MSLVSDTFRSRELLANLTRREISGKYKRTALGQLWSLVNPLAQMVIFWAVFSFVIRIKPAPGDPSGLDIFAVWLLCGLLPWAFFANVVNNGMASLVSNENLIKKVWFPRLVLPVSSTLAVVVSWAIEMAVLTVVLVVVGGRPLVWLPLVVVAMALLALFSLGVGLMFAVLNVYFRDTQHFIGILMQAWFYATPVIYPVSYVAKVSGETGALFGSVTLYDLYRLNPMERFLEVFRTLLYDNRWPPLDSTLAAFGWAAAALALGLWVFSRHQRRLAEVL
ncbi:ABC transporter permease [Isoptericola sp. b441]|uniref:Transport permease protein n=1 Tax=Actinotalea lenta TaxID=3064654 RepID=A0ABT9DD44_9CELL|nr:MULTISPECIES: ABC transporter permease [unclassified Isoptericola]MDO8108550.1 ABC transporter permease [Isoptericola sp. b441]MDO8119960.1 ABC transporter permease [Isoptericola sp. b490]